MYCTYLCFSGACPIELEDRVILTGGYIVQNGSPDIRAIVSIYDENGWRRDLPSLQQKRNSHGCGSYINDDNNIVSI